MRIGPSRIQRRLGQAAAAGLLLALATTAHAALTITAPNAGRGFVITDFVTGMPNTGPGSQGPIGVAFRPDHHVLLTDPDAGNLYQLPSHADGQVLSALDFVASYTAPLWGLVQVQIGGAWHYFASDFGNFVEIDPSTGAELRSIPGAATLGMAPYPAGLSGPHAGHIFTGGTFIVWEVDPVAWTATPFMIQTEANTDGLAISPDGTRLYTVHSDSIFAWDMATTGMTWVGPTHPGEGYDGIALGVGSLAGYVYVNCNNGDLWEFGLPGGPHAGVDNLLATGGTRGDFIAADPDVQSGGSYPSLLLTQTDRIVRIDPPGGGWFGPPTSSLQPVGSAAAVLAPGTPAATHLVSVAPNPAFSSARVEFALAQESRASLAVFDLQGRRVATLAGGVLEAGPHIATWDGASPRGPAPAGVYFVRLEAAGRSDARRIVLTR